MRNYKIDKKFLFYKREKKMDFSKLKIGEAIEFLQFNGVQETSLDLLTVQTRALQVYTERNRTNSTVYTLIFLALDRAGRFPSTNKYTERQIINLTPEQLQIFGQYYQFDPTTPYAKQFLWRILEIQGNTLPEPPVQVIQPIQPYVAPTPNIVTNVVPVDPEYRNRVNEVFSNVPVGIVKEFVKLNSTIALPVNSSHMVIYSTGINTYIDSVQRTGTVKGLNKIAIRLIHVAISKFNSNKFTEGQIRNFTAQQLNDIFTYYGLQDLKNVSREDHINIITTVLFYQDNLIEPQPTIQPIQPYVAPVVQPNLIDFNTIQPTPTPINKPIVMSPIKQLSPVQSLQLSPRKSPSVFTDIQMSPKPGPSTSSNTGGKMSPKSDTLTRQTIIGPQSYTPEFAKIKNAEDELRRHYAENAFANPLRYDAFNPTYNLMDVTDKADTYIDAYKSIQRSNYVTADSVFASYALSTIKGNTPTGTPEFRNTFFTMMNSLIPEKFKNNLVIAGGFVLSYFGVRLKNNDIDIFIVGTDKPELILTEYMNWFTEESSFYVGRRSPYAITIFRKKDMKQPISIILRQYKSPSEIMTGFDLDASCFCFYNGRVWTSARGDYALRNRTNTVDIERLSPSYNYRLLKYGLTKGFRVVVPGLKKTESMARKIEQNLEDGKNKTFGCVGLYALLRMEVVKNKDPNRFYENIGETSDYDMNMRNILYNDGTLTELKREIKDIIKSKINKDFKGDDQSVYFERIGTEAHNNKAIYYTKDPILLLQDDKLIGKILSNKPVFIKENPGKQGYYTSSFHPIQTTWPEWSDLNNCVPAALNANGTVDVGSTSFKKFASMPEGH